MKKALLYLMTIALFVTTSCSDDNDDVGGAANAVTNALRSGSWRITSYVDNGTDETADFNGFNFVFTGGTVTASNSILSVTGAWSTGIDDSKHKLVLAFSTSSLSMFQEISEDWEIVANSSTQVSLRHVSGGSGETDTLVFTKN